jgi:hypothetical protein
MLVAEHEDEQLLSKLPIPELDKHGDLEPSVPIFMPEEEDNGKN